MKILLIFVIVATAFAEPVLKKQRISGSGGFVAEKVYFERNDEVLDAPEVRDIFEINKEFGQQGLTDGDIRPRSLTRNSIIDKTYFWPSTTIPVQYGNRLGLLAISGIEDARQEYEMRTCFSFPDKTNERDYLLYEPLDGCWSYVGVQGGRQTVSIGSGCEQMSTIQHEMMHAIGIYHEQSRTDRDGYIYIDTDNIDPDMVYNFDKYSYEVVDNRRVAYDYNSIMHYGDTSFSNNGGKTIITRDPAFQDVIGQRRTFSEGDVTMINRMYPCSDPLRVSYTCNFEEEAICGYVQDTTDQLDWFKFNVGVSDPKNFNSFVPLVDNTHGKADTGSYMVFDTSNKVGSEIGNLVSMRLKSNSTKQCLEFGYYMDLVAGSPAGMAVHLGTIDQSNGDILSTAPLVTITGDHGNYWNTERLTIEAPSKYKLVIVGKSDIYTDDAIAIDDFSILDKPCETSYFTVHDFSSLLASTTKGDMIYSPLLYTDEGYAFKIMFYPHGTSSAADGYMSMFYAVAQGVNDDNLPWPFYNQVIKMTVVDQGPDALTRMSEYANYITSAAGAPNFDRPLTEVNSGWGYSNFMKLSDVMNTRDFLKNDAIVISINVRDMNNFQRDHASRFAEPAPSVPIMRSSYDNSDHEDNHEDDHENDHENEHEINGPIIPCKNDEQDGIPKATVAGIALGSSILVFIIMTVLLMCTTNSHKQALAIVASSAARPNHQTCHFNNLSYETEGKPKK
uniref:meprin A subunit alpha-like n=1 Tax=Ciona intestinalis TaxID=7719 RepID=UPI00006A5BBE|nr:meprin A subunit alpha-like [Ciona intestinalis]|eukprot:XP_002128075.1 meprin A subunit alpha-like [Ciona intestinalis]